MSLPGAGWTTTPRICEASIFPSICPTWRSTAAASSWANWSVNWWPTWTFQANGCRPWRRWPGTWPVCVTTRRSWRAAERLEKRRRVVPGAQAMCSGSAVTLEPLDGGAAASAMSLPVRKVRSSCSSTRQPARRSFGPKRRQGERDEHKRADQATVLKYLEKYEHQLVGHVIEREGQEPFIVCRTNNPAEHRFQVT